MKKFKGSKGVLWTWIILFWPVAIVYWAMKQEQVNTKNKR